MMHREFAVEPHDDGTLTIDHYGTRYIHWWVAEVKRTRQGWRAIIYGKTGGEAWINLFNKEEADAILAAREQAQEAARKIAQS